MSETVEIERVDTTEKGNPVYQNTSGEGRIVGIPNDGEVYIPAVITFGDTTLPELVDPLVNAVGNNRLVFANVINDGLKESLQGFKEEREYAEQYQEYVTVLRGKWND